MNNTEFEVTLRTDKGTEVKHIESIDENALSAILYQRMNTTFEVMEVRKH